MKKVEISYNPYTEKASMWIDGVQYAYSGSRVTEFVTGRPMEQWISYYSVSYKHWDGFLPELAEELNDDKLELVFRGIKEDYDIFSAGIMQTYEDVRIRGFEPNNCSLSWKSKYTPEEMLPLFGRFARQQLMMLTTQMDILRMEALCDRLEQTDSMEIEDIRDIIKDLESFLQDVAAYSRTEKLENYWNGVVRQFTYICEEGR